MARKGRDLERLVSILERGMASADVAVRSPDYVVDSVSKEKREVDVTIRQKTHVGEMLTIVECRDRKATDDVTWIEQLATKAKDVRAMRVLAVSSSRFSKGAQLKATHYGIELRTMDEISNEDLQNWIVPSSLITIVQRHSIVGMTLISRDALLENMHLHFDSNAKYFIHANGQQLSTNDLFNGIPKLGSYWPPDNEQQVKKMQKFLVDLREASVFFKVGQQLAKIDGIKMQVELWNDIQETPSMKMFTYSSEHERLVGGSKFRVMLKGNEFSLIAHTTRRNDEQTVKFTLQPTNEPRQDLGQNQSQGLTRGSKSG